MGKTISLDYRPGPSFSYKRISGGRLENIKRMVGEQIRKLRKKKGLTQEGLGWKADLHYTYIGAVERGEKNCSLDSLNKIAKALDVRIHDLLNISLRTDEVFGEAPSKSSDKQIAKALLLKEIKKCSPEVIKLFADLIKAIEKQTIPGK